MPRARGRLVPWATAATAATAYLRLVCGMCVAGKGPRKGSFGAGGRWPAVGGWVKIRALMGGVWRWRFLVCEVWDGLVRGRGRCDEVRCWWW